MSQYERFVRDYFELGKPKWLDHYANRVPAGMSADLFVQELERLHLEQEFIDRCDWSDGRAPSQYLYLIAEEPRRYCVYTVERAIPFLEGTYLTLHDAMRHKARLIFGALELAAFPVKPLVRE
jgi:hypothetical protein